MWQPTDLVQTESEEGAADIGNIDCKFITGRDPVIS